MYVCAKYVFMLGMYKCVYETFLSLAILRQSTNLIIYSIIFVIFCCLVLIASGKLFCWKKQSLVSHKLFLSFALNWLSGSRTWARFLMYTILMPIKINEPYTRFPNVVQTLIQTLEWLLFSDLCNFGWPQKNILIKRELHRLVKWVSFI